MPISHDSEYQCSGIDDTEKCNVAKFMRRERSYIAKTCMSKGKFGELTKYIWGYLFSDFEQINSMYLIIY